MQTPFGAPASHAAQAADTMRRMQKFPGNSRTDRRSLQRHGESMMPLRGVFPEQLAQPLQ